MHLLKASDRYEIMERWLAQEIVAKIKEKLSSHGVSVGEQTQLAQEIAIGIADLWDGCHGHVINGEMISPFLSFAIDNDEETVLVNSYDYTGSCLHEHVANSDLWHGPN